VISAGIISWKAFNNFNIDLCGKYIGDQFLDNTSNDNRKLDAYFINDLRLTYSLPVKNLKGIDFRVTLNNILDKKYISNGYTYSEFSGGTRYDYNNYFPQAGFNFMAGVAIKF
jgi:iron complex outermembrane receptor protein